MQYGRSILLICLLAAAPARAQTVNVTFRYVPSGAVERAFVPGTFNGWGAPYTAGCIAAGHTAEMGLFEDYWALTVPLQAGQRYEYKIQTHGDTSGSNCAWQSDPWNAVTNPQNNNNSVLDLADPMAFQVAEELSGSGLVRFFSASLVSSQPITSISFSVNGGARTDGLDFYDAATGVFRHRTDQQLRSGAQFMLEAIDAGNRTINISIGSLQPPVDWVYPAYSTVKETARLKALITRLDGSVDPAVTTANLFDRGEDAGSWPVIDGVLDIEAPVSIGAHRFTIEATVEGQTYTSAELAVTRRLHPLDDRLIDSVDVTGSGFAFDAQVTLMPIPIIPELAFDWRFDETFSTTTLSSGVASGQGTHFSGTAADAGELYFDVYAGDMNTLPANATFERRVAVIVDGDGSARQMAYEENAEWTKRAIVYEVFPLQFGPTSSGSSANPSGRLKQITAELDYVAAMGFTAIWFMPVFQNQSMTAVSGGYNITDFMHIDPTIGTDADFRALVDRAHELGIRIVLDMTPSHTSPIHPWVESLRQDGPFAPYIQTTPSDHDRGLDSPRMANLDEIWQVENGRDLYRKYDGFGDLANVDWDDDDLQAAMLDIFAYWTREFDVDGWRIDVYWGPWMRYGPERFGRPLREIVKRIRPDAWMLGEIAGTGSSTEVYYADDDRGKAVVGGLDAAYDWTFYHEGVRASYPSLSSYNARSINGNFWPGPNARYFRFLENHDENRIAYLHRANPDRLRPLAGWLLTTTGVPMVYAGQEVGFGAAHDYTQRDPVDWNTPNNGRLAALYQRLAQARFQYPAFWTQELEAVFIGNSFRGEPLAYAYARPYLDQNALVVVNFDDDPATMTLDPSAVMRMTTDGPIPYYDLAADTSAAYLGAFTVTVPPYETVVYITSDAPGFDVPVLPPLPYNAVYTGTASVEDALPDLIRLGVNYPNPFNPETTIRFDLPSGSAVRLEVYDVLGRRVAVLADGVFAPGRHDVRFNGSSLPSGTYLYRLEAGSRVLVKTMVLVK